MLASTFFDMVVGVDIHWEMLPAPPAPPPAGIPTPLPNPFVGMTFDPVGLAVGMAIGGAVSAVTGASFKGPVLVWTAFPAVNTGTEAKNYLGIPHILIPPGFAWAPVPKTPKPVIRPGETPDPPKPVMPDGDAVIITGSKTVTVMGSNWSRLGDLALSCSEPVRLPSSTVIPIPKGAPTAPELIARCGQAELESERADFHRWMERLGHITSDSQLVAHPAFGNLSHKEYGVLMARHADHHLRQFGV